MNATMNSTADSLNSTPEPVASVSELTVRYGAHTVLENLSLQVPAGCTGLLGPNGAGKTTLIKSLLGFVAPASGTGTILGCDIVRQSLRIRQLIGLMPEQECHIPGMNAVSFVAYAGELAGMPRAQALRRAHEVLEYCALGEARYRNVETYSTGMKQRIKLAQALVHGPKLLFLDEPTNGLDPGGRDEMLDLIRDVSHGKGLSVIVSSHLLPDIERTCDSVLVMKAGRLVTQGGIAELRQRAGLQVDVDLRLFSEAFTQSMARRGAQLGSRQGARCRFVFESAGNGAANETVAPTLETLGDGVRHAPSESELGRLIFEAAGESGVQVRGFRPAQRSLEDVFLEAMDA